MKIYLIVQADGWDSSVITGVFTDKRQAEKYAKKSKKLSGGWGNRVDTYVLDKFYEEGFGFDGGGFGEEEE